MIENKRGIPIPYREVNTAPNPANLFQEEVLHFISALASKV